MCEICLGGFFLHSLTETMDLKQLIGVNLPGRSVEGLRWKDDGIFPTVHPSSLQFGKPTLKHPTLWYWKWPSIVSFPIKNCDFPVRYVNVFQAGYVGLLPDSLFGWVEPPLWFQEHPESPRATRYLQNPSPEVGRQDRSWSNMAMENMDEEGWTSNFHHNYG
jgi:hypothetical protein